MQLNITTRQLVTLRLIVPGNQCGSLIGKAGANIKAIRQVIKRPVCASNLGFIFDERLIHLDQISALGLSQTFCSRFRELRCVRP